MKKILFSVLLIGMSFQLFAGGKKYIAAMKDALALIENAKTVADYQNAANRFERIGNAEKKEWLPFYYASLCYATMTYFEPDIEKKDPQLDRAEEYLKLAEDIKKKDFDRSELYVIKGMIYGSRIQVDPQTRGMKYGPLSGQMYGKAISLNPNNPRALSLSGQSTMYTPEQFGGGRAKAIPMLKQALELYDSWESPSEIYPEWGKEMAQNSLEFAQSGKKAPWEEGAEEEKTEEKPTDK